jgi:hypothetical protein
MLTDSGDLSGHERLDPTCEITCPCENHDRKLAVEATRAACNKGRLETNTLVYILADYIQVPELDALAVRKFAATLEGDCQDGLGDVCYLVHVLPIRSRAVDRNSSTTRPSWVLPLLHLSYYETLSHMSFANIAQHPMKGMLQSPCV